MTALIAHLPGDGIGPEVTAAALQVCAAAARHSGVSLRIDTALIGGTAIDAVGDPLPRETLELCRSADAALLGAVGGPQWTGADNAPRPEAGLLRLRRELGLFANLRPVAPLPACAAASPLRPERLAGVDVLFVRELTGGIYFGGSEADSERAVDRCVYTRSEVERVVRVAARLAQQRGGRLTSVDKANVLATSRLWRQTTDAVVAAEFPDLQLEHQLVDAMAMHLLARPADFDVVVTENMFGDILTDEASMLAGSLGVLPSASLGETTFGLYEPVHGSAPDLAGRNVANPIGAVLSGALMLRHSLQLPDAADRIEAAVAEVTRRGIVTPDLATEATTAGRPAAHTDEVTAALLEVLAPAASGAPPRPI